MSKLERAVIAAERIEGWMAPDELRWLGEQAALRRRIVEIGSFCGRSTKVLALMCRGTVISVDNLAFDAEGFSEDQDLEFRRNLRNHLRSGRVQTIRKSSVAAARGFRGSADMIFIDGAHEKADVLADLKAWVPKLAKRGLLCGHDLSYPGVQEALEEFGIDYEQAAGDLWHDANGIPIGGIWAAR